MCGNNLWIWPNRFTRSRLDFPKKSCTVYQYRFDGQLSLYQAVSPKVRLDIREQNSSIFCISSRVRLPSLKPNSCWPCTWDSSPGTIHSLMSMTFGRCYSVFVVLSKKLPSPMTHRSLRLHHEFHRNHLACRWIPGPRPFFRSMAHSMDCVGATSGKPCASGILVHELDRGIDHPRLCRLPERPGIYRRPDCRHLRLSPKPDDAQANFEQR